MSVEIKGNLSVTYINGRYGKFPTATLSTNIGQFAIRDSWLEDLENGAYEGNFIISNISLFHYFSFNELRVGQRAYVEDYKINKIEKSDIDKANKPEIKKPIVIKDKNPKPKKIASFSNEELAAEKLLRSCKPEDEVWAVGQSYIVDKSMSRERIQECTKALSVLNYKLDVMTQTWFRGGS